MDRFNKVVFLALVSFFSMVTFQQSALAQDASTEDIAPSTSTNSKVSDSEVDGTIIITARKREESLQEFAGAATVISDEDFETNLITNLSDLRDLVPNLYLEQGLGGGSTPKIFVRGIGIDNPDVSFDSPVGIYIDGVYYARAFGALTDLYDIEQVEFLRGPQGTLYGRNNSAGALRVITKKPELDRFDMGFSLGFGTESQINANIFVNKPIEEDKSGFRFSLSSRQNDGFMTELNSGEKNFKDDNVSGRAAFLYLIDEQWQLTARADFLDESGGAALGSSIVPAFNADDDIYTASLNFNPSTSLEVWGTSLEVVRKGETFDFTSITAYREVTMRNSNGDADGTPLNLLEGLVQNLDESQVTEEAFITTSGDSIDWTAGIFLMSEQNDSEQSFNVFPAVFGPATRQLIELETDSFAVYGEADFELSERLTLTAGVRYTDESKEIMFQSFELDGTFGFALDEEVSIDKTTWKVGVDYIVSDDFFVYASAGTGFRSGGIGINPAARNVGNVVSDIFEPETAESYEVGFKSSYLDNRVQFNATYFSVDYEKLQLAVAGTGGITVNTPDATVDGIELEVRAKISDDFTANLTAGTQNDEIKESDLELKNTPDLQARLGLTYITSLSGNGGDITIAGDISYTDDYFVSTANSVLINGFSLVNMMTKWNSADGRFAVSIAAKNITDKYYFTHAFRIIPGLLDTQFPSRGRTWLASFHYNY